MYLDLNFRDDSWEPPPIRCMSCKHPIGRGHTLEEINIDSAIDPELEDMNGPYHAECAKPLLSVIRALEMLRFRPF